nr:hypothetical protein K-LCC10_0224 [Kaumoebavirus]
MLIFLLRQMDSELFAWLCGQMPREIVRIIEDYLLCHPKTVAGIVKGCIERKGDTELRISLHPSQLKMIRWLRYCEDCGNLQYNQIENFIDRRDAGGVCDSMICYHYMRRRIIFHSFAEKWKS